jgi:hypothetical protein
MMNSSSMHISFPEGYRVIDPAIRHGANADHDLITEGAIGRITWIQKIKETTNRTNNISYTESVKSLSNGSKMRQSFSNYSLYTPNLPLHLKSRYHKPTNRCRGFLRVSVKTETGYNARNTPQPQSASSGFQGLGGGALNKLFAK